MSAVGTVEVERAGESPELSQAKIFRFFSPLAWSWICMSVEGPLSVALISRLPNAEVSTAAFQIVMGLAFWTESPIIDLLSTSTTLAKTRQNYVQLSRFVWYLIAIVVAVHAILAFTPLYWLVTRNLMGVPEDVAATGRIGLQVMLPWAALIGWRRYLQGLLIRNAQTRLVGFGTAIRVLGMFGGAFLLYWTVHLPSIEIAGIALICAVGGEALFAHLASRRTVREHYSPGASSKTGPDISMAKLRSFHLPLTATTMVTMLASPAISAALSHIRNPDAELAGYQVAATLTWLMRTTVFALPEVVITLYRDERSAAALRRFTLCLATVTSGTMLAVWLTGLDELFFRHVLGTKESLVSLAHVAFISAVLMPFAGAWQSYVRGMLTAHHLTVSRLLAVSVSTAALAGSLVVTHYLGIEGVVAAGICPTVAIAAELAVLACAWVKRPATGLQM